MSVNNQRMKWWEKYRNQSVKGGVFTIRTDLRDLACAALLRMLHAKVDKLDIDKELDAIIQKVGEGYGEQEIMEYVLHYTPELNKQKEDVDD